MPIKCYYEHRSYITFPPKQQDDNVFSTYNDYSKSVTIKKQSKDNNYGEFSFIKVLTPDKKDGYEINRQWKRRERLDNLCQQIIGTTFYPKCDFQEYKSDVEIMIVLLLNKLETFETEVDKLYKVELETDGSSHNLLHYEEDYEVKNDPQLIVLAVATVSLSLKFIIDDCPDIVKCYKKWYYGIFDMEISVLTHVDFKLITIWYESQEILNSIGSALKRL